ncbi:hypothetical protein SMICM17S_10648 [Streptomyces microflavus]
MTRKSYKDPVVAAQIIRDGKKTQTKALPAGLVKDFSGLPDFAQISVIDAAGKSVLEKTEAFCPNNASGRARPDAPANSKYPQSCPVNPFTLGSVWGVENGWAANTYAGYYSDAVQLPAGTYTAKISVTKKYRDLFGIEDKPQSVKVTVRERSWEGEGGGEGVSASSESSESSAGASSKTDAHAGDGSAASEHAGHAAAAPAAPSGHAGHGAPARTDAPAAATTGAGSTFNVGHGPYPPAPPALPWALKKQATEKGALRPQGFSAAAVGDRTGQTDGSRQAPGVQPNAKRPAGKATVPDVPKPDLRSLPAYGITVSDGYEDVPGKDYLAFSANVWNAGPAKLVVDGFRSPGKELMDAYQYFYDADGKQVGYTPTGTMVVGPAPRSRALALHGLRQLPAAEGRPEGDRPQRQRRRSWRRTRRGSRRWRRSPECALVAVAAHRLDPLGVDDPGAEDAGGLLDEGPRADGLGAGGVPDVRLRGLALQRAHGRHHAAVVLEVVVRVRDVVLAGVGVLRGDLDPLVRGLHLLAGRAAVELAAVGVTAPDRVDLGEVGVGAPVAGVDELEEPGAVRAGPRARRPGRRARRRRRTRAARPRRSP